MLRKKNRITINIELNQQWQAINIDTVCVDCTYTSQLTPSDLNILLYGTADGKTM